MTQKSENVNTEKKYLTVPPFTGKKPEIQRDMLGSRSCIKLLMAELGQEPGPISPGPASSLTDSPLSNLTAAESQFPEWVQGQQ